MYYNGWNLAMYLHATLLAVLFSLGNCQIETRVTITPSNPEAGEEVKFLCQFELNRNDQVRPQI